MDFKRSKKLLAALAACYWVLALLIYLIAGDQFHYTAVTGDALSASAVISFVAQPRRSSSEISPSERAS